MQPAEAFDHVAFLSRSRPDLVSFFRRRCGNPEEAEDLAQDVLVRALRHHDWKSSEQARAYIFRAAVNRWRDRGRRKLAHSAVITDEALVEGANEEISLERVLSSREELEILVTALSELGERTRTILVLSRLEQFKHADIARLFNVSVSAVEKHLARALAHVARRLSAASLRSDRRLRKAAAGGAGRRRVSAPPGGQPDGTRAVRLGRVAVGSGLRRGLAAGRAGLDRLGRARGSEPVQGAS